MSASPTGNVADHAAPPPSEQPRKKSGTGRLLSVDFVRGVGILCFIFWHSANYFFAGGSWSSPPVRATLFATGLFIFTAGVLLGLHYGPIYRIPENRAKTARRLIVRGGKILAIFLVAGIASRGVPRPGPIIALLSDIASLVYAQRWDIPLQILAPIAAVLATGPILLRVFEILGPVRSAAAWLLIGAVDALLPTAIPYFWHYYLIGFAGIWAGGVAAARWDSLSDRVLTTSPLAYLGILAAFLLLDGIAFASEKPYEILLSRLVPNLLIISLFFLTCALPILRRVDLGGAPAGPVVRLMAVMGKHTLACYLLQVFLLTVLKKSRLVTPSDSLVLTAAISVGVAGACFAASLGAESLGPRGRRIYSIFLG